MFCSLVFIVVVHAAGCNIASLMHRRRCDKLHGGLSHLLFACPAHHRSIASCIADDRDLCLPHLHSTSPLGGGSLVKYCHDVWYGKEKLEWLGYTTAKKSEDTFIHFDRILKHEGRTDTAWRHMPHSCIASHGKNATVQIHRLQVLSSTIASGRQCNDMQTNHNEDDIPMHCVSCPCSSDELGCSTSDFLAVFLDFFRSLEHHFHSGCCLKWASFTCQHQSHPREDCPSPVPQHGFTSMCRCNKPHNERLLWHWLELWVGYLS